MIYGIVSDIHFHGWSAFSHIRNDGVNSRLAISIDELKRAAAAVKHAGGKLLVITGDVFHVRGSVAPSVLNPVRDAFEEITRVMGLQVLILPGNHDLEGKECDRIGNACEALRMPGVIIANQPDIYLSNLLAVVPWFSTVEGLKEAIIKLKAKIESNGTSPEAVDLLLHAPIDGVIAGLPPHGLTADWLASLGFMRVFSGHYHNHKDFGNGVYSVGALTHLTWGDVGSKAGFLIVDEEKVKWHSTNAPMFTDVQEGEEWDVILERASGNFVRAKVREKPKASDIEEFRQQLLKSGAKGVRVDVIRTEGRKRDDTLTEVKGESLTLEESIGAFVKKKGYGERVAVEAMKVLAEANAMGAA